MADAHPSPARQAMDDQLDMWLRDHGLVGRLACPRCDANLRESAIEENAFVVLWPTVRDGEEFNQFVIAKVRATAQGGGE